VGDWTAQIGDPSGVSVTRPMLSEENVRSNAETYMQQFFKVVDKEKTEVRWQSEWFGNFSLKDVIRLTSKFTIAQFLAREDFNKRYHEVRPISLCEFIYPLLQAYDSVAIKSDVEFGGTDQKFNLLVGRELQGMVGQNPQQIFTVPLLVGTDGVHKMSKSLGNYIGVAESPQDIFGKVMSVADSLIMQYFELLTDVPDIELNDFKKGLESGSLNPMNLKKRLAAEIIAQLYSKDEAIAADENFTRVFQKRETPEEIKLGTKGGVGVLDFLLENRLVKSKGEGRRLIEQGAVDIDGKTVKDTNSIVPTSATVKVGKTRYIQST